MSHLWSPSFVFVGPLRAPGVGLLVALLTPRPHAGELRASVSQRCLGHRPPWTFPPDASPDAGLTGLGAATAPRVCTLEGPWTQCSSVTCPQTSSDHFTSCGQFQRVSPQWEGLEWPSRLLSRLLPPVLPVILWRVWCPRWPSGTRLTQSHPLFHGLLPGRVTAQTTGCPSGYRREDVSTCVYMHAPRRGGTQAVAVLGAPGERPRSGAAPRAARKSRWSHLRPGPEGRTSNGTSGGFGPVWFYQWNRTVPALHYRPGHPRWPLSKVLGVQKI